MRGDHFIRGIGDTATCKKFLSGWMQENESTLEIGPPQNFYTSGRKPSGWCRVAKGTYRGDGVKFMIFDRWGTQDMKNVTHTFKTPAKYAVIWFHPDGVVLEWRDLDAALLLGARISNHCGNYFEPKNK